MFAATNLAVQFNFSTLFEDISFELLSGELLHVQGANGTGKSTLLKTLTGLMSPDKGSVYFNGEDIREIHFEFKNALAYLGHKLGVKLSLTAAENLAQNFNDVMGITSFANKLVERLSAGQKQRVALTRIVNSDAKLWVLDEPFTSLDKNSIALFQAELQRHLRAGNMAIISSHQRLMLNDVQIKTLNLSEQTP